MSSLSFFLLAALFVLPGLKEPLFICLALLGVSLLSAMILSFEFGVWFAGLLILAYVGALLVLVLYVSLTGTNQNAFGRNSPSSALVFLAALNVWLIFQEAPFSSFCLDLPTFGQNLGLSPLTYILMASWLLALLLGLNKRLEGASALSATA